MKRNVLVFGSISGLIIAALMVFSSIWCYKDPNFEANMVIGYATMLVSFSFIFVGIKNLRDKHNGGVITFGQAFKLGLYISLIASSAYVATWLVEYYFFIPDFMDKYGAHVIKEAQNSGATQAELDKQIAKMDQYKEMYKNPVFVILLTYMEVLPLGIVISVISAFILKRKAKADTVAVN